MAILIPCRLPCRSEEDQSQSHSDYLVNSESSASSSLSSQPSLPSVHSLTPSPDQQHGQQSSPSTHHHCLATFKAHSSYVSSLVVAGKFIYTGSSNSEIRAWSRDPSQLKNNSAVDNLVAVSESAVKSLVVLGDTLFSAHQDHKIRVWNKIEHHVSNPTQPQKFKCIATLPTLNDRISRFFWAKNYVEVRRHKKITWVHHVDAVSALAVSKDGSLLYSASWDRTFKVWRTSDFKCLESVSKAHDDAINAIELSEDGYVYTGSADKKIKVWKKKFDGDKKHCLVSTLEKHKSAVNALALSSDGSALYSGACDRSILVWEKDGENDSMMVVVGALRGHTKAILCLAVVEDLLLSGSADCSVRIWRRGIDRRFCCLGVLEGYRRPVKCLTVTVDCSYRQRNDDSAGSCYLLYSGSLDGEVKSF
ncbi:hypothetical protein FEM48_Zijuj10G0063000 [Ziziphus jujuba var. spinosa]|uniref:Protein JINGUBANG-like n=1 Tax=Ziziphus jujuba var. spinosa TaxID=714518 RepID=A0A978ULT0_ZIZJJ|nr:hypothetical protein FEM48_Zijuj10G0063000 [Ziziphus jujuba var. spinosa]